MEIREFFHPGYARNGLRAVHVIGDTAYYCEVLNKEIHTQYSSDEVWEFKTYSEYAIFERFIEDYERGWDKLD